MNRLLEYALSEPRRLINLGHALGMVGVFILIVGAIGTVVTGAQVIAQGSAPQLAALYPSIPTWWVPESIPGCVPAIVLILTGISVGLLGRRLRDAYF